MQVVTWCRWVLTPDYKIFAIPNGGKRHIAEAKKLKLTGVLPGVFDLMIIGPKPNCFWIEMKMPKGKLSEHQEEFRSFLQDSKWEFGIAHSLAEVQALFIKWKIPTKMSK